MNSKWTEKEINYLKENYYKKSLNEMSEYLNRNTSAIKTKACKLNITKNQMWTEEEIE